MLNNITKKDVYPLPRIGEALECMYGSRRFTSLDLHAGYWQVPAADDDKDKTEFVTRQGLFRFARMPFGLANAPGTFQRMMDAVVRGLTWGSCLVYQNDVIIFSGGEGSRHVVEKAAVMDRLATAGLPSQPKKCSFAMEKLGYLGHQLDAEGIWPLEKMVDSARGFPTAFESLKVELTERPLLIYPDFSKSFKLVMDASAVGLGASLMQDHANGDHPVAYASQVNSPTEAKYGTTDLECRWYNAFDLIGMDGGSNWKRTTQPWLI
ncbi:unnamed protein product [Phytophthora fragariaefolia]|uniref:Unnamed protein product n=1 Tax=Phytophthora fragariaefolia TaxID=1490495 RepID=A0A9W6XYH9_9STRA|nr:unnamed protein product [Phytophthora fragariaefolia]